MLEDIEGMPIVEEKTVSELVGRDSEDDSLFERLFQIYVEEYPELLRDLRNALSAKDSNACYEVIHQMKGSAAAIGAARVFALSEKAIKLCESKEILSQKGVVEILEGEMAAYCEEIKKRRA